ncbi:MAG TPA: dephospho-CoA kinase [Clostridia bacterium]|nr:dephospho-CoA kinase [Clostridia bacterium]
MKIIGLTGGIASGKSLVAGMLTRLGAEVIDADEVGHQVIEPGLPAYYEIVNTFGAAILDSNGKVNRKKLGEVVFSCPDKLQKLNHITHPRILSKIHDLIEVTKKQRPQAIVVNEAALLFEIGLHLLVDEVWTVESDIGIQVQRIKQRNKVTEEQALARIKSQLPSDRRIARADRVIYNNAGVDKLFGDVMEIWGSFLN